MAQLRLQAGLIKNSTGTQKVKKYTNLSKTKNILNIYIKKTNVARLFTFFVKTVNSN